MTLGMVMLRRLSMAEKCLVLMQYADMEIPPSRSSAFLTPLGRKVGKGVDGVWQRALDLDLGTILGPRLEALKPSPFQPLCSVSFHSPDLRDSTFLCLSVTPTRSLLSQASA